MERGRAQDEAGWRLAHKLSSGTEPNVAFGSSGIEAAIAIDVRRAAEFSEATTDLLASEVADIFERAGRVQVHSWMTFHRKPYCWHELLNYLQVDPFAQGQLYGLANINAVGWQEASFVLRKLIDEKTIEEACAQERKKYHDKENEDEGVRTPS